MPMTAPTQAEKETTKPSPYAVAGYSDQGEPIPDIVTYAKAYAHQNPDVTAMWCFGIGFVLGWKLKPW